MQQFASTGPQQPGDPDDFPLAHDETDRAKPAPRRETAHDEAFLPGDRRVGLPEALHRGDDTSDDRFGDGVLVDVLGLSPHDFTAVAQHRDIVGQRDHFIEKVRNEDDPLALSGEAANRLIDDLSLVVGERGGRLVHHDEIGAAAERLHYRHHLPATDRQVADNLVAVDGIADFLA